MAETPEPNKPEPNEEADSHLKAGKLPNPRRGAIPTPRAEIEKAKPYIPETDQEGDKSATEPVSPESVDREEDSQEERGNS